jgi:hypothetical protein
MMKKIFYISVFLVLFVQTGFSFVPNPLYVDSYSLDGYPELFKISAPIPNPVIDYAEVWCNIPENKNAEVAIYNFAGVKLKSFPVSGGLNRIDLEAWGLQSGVYFVCLLYEGKNIDSKKLVKK